MKSILTVATAMAVLLGMLAVPVRADDEKKAEKSDKDVAVMCEKCGAVWVKAPQTVGRTTVYVSRKKMLCDDCKTAVENFFTTGKLEHSCKKCGKLEACEAMREDAAK